MFSALVLQPNILLFIAFTCIVGGIVLFILSIPSRKGSSENKEDDVNRRYHKIINNAHNEARAILDTTSLTSAGILADSKATSEHMEENLDKVLQKIAAEHINALKQSTDQFTKSYDDKLAALQEQLTSHTAQSIRESEERINQTLENYMKPIADSASNSRSTIDQRTQEMLSQVEKEIEEYKAARIQKIENEVQDLVRRTFHDVIHESIPESVQEELVIKSLEKAKLEGGLSL